MNIKFLIDHFFPRFISLNYIKPYNLHEQGKTMACLHMNTRRKIEAGKIELQENEAGRSNAPYSEISKEMRKCFAYWNVNLNDNSEDYSPSECGTLYQPYTGSDKCEKKKGGQLRCCRLPQAWRTGDAMSSFYAFLYQRTYQFLSRDMIAL